ncbi:MAG: hypothetical protein ACT4P4_09640 [Betaproteobacteria bacterium]
MLRLLGDVRLHSVCRKVPILCVLGTTGRSLSDITIEGLDHAVKATRGVAFIELNSARSASRPLAEAPIPTT